MPRRTRSRKTARTATSEQRREPRRRTAQPVVVRGLLKPGERFDQPGRSKDASLRGMSLLLPIPLAVDSPVLVENPTTGVRTLYRVVRVEPRGKGVYAVGFEAPDPHPRFWSKSPKK